MGKLVLKEEDRKTLSKRLQGWGYPQLVVSFGLMTFITSSDFVIPDFIPFIDEAFLASATAMLGWALFWKGVGTVRGWFAAKPEPESKP